MSTCFKKFVVFSYYREVRNCVSQTYTEDELPQ